MKNPFKDLSLNEVMTLLGYTKVKTEALAQIDLGGFEIYNSRGEHVGTHNAASLWNYLWGTGMMAKARKIYEGKTA